MDKKGRTTASINTPSVRITTSQSANLTLVVPWSSDLGWESSSLLVHLLYTVSCKKPSSPQNGEFISAHQISYQFCNTHGICFQYIPQAYGRGMAQRFKCHTARRHTTPGLSSAGRVQPVSTFFFSQPLPALRGCPKANLGPAELSWVEPINQSFWPPQPSPPPRQWKFGYMLNPGATFVPMPNLHNTNPHDYEYEY